MRHKKITSVIENHTEGGNLAYELKDNGYIPNVNLFVFNYPNQDAVVHNAQKLKIYVNNLILYANNSGSVGMKQAFAIDGESYSFDIVGHSMGGLVARYYIENCTKYSHYLSSNHNENGECERNDHHVRKLITIDTPHWGSRMAELSNESGFKHELCDHGLSYQSTMYNGGNSFFDCSAWDNNCVAENYLFTDRLEYENTRETKYYAVAGISFYSSFLDKNDIFFEIPTNCSTYNELADSIQGNEQIGYLLNDGIPWTVFRCGDDIVSFTSQVGWTENDGISPNTRINFEKIFVDIDTNGGNGLLIGGYFHSKIQHRQPVMEKICNYLEE